MNNFIVTIALLLAISTPALGFVPSVPRGRPSQAIKKVRVSARSSALSSTTTPVASEEKIIGGVFVDEEAALAASTFAIKPPELIELAKNALRLGAGTEDPTILASDFEFCAPVVGPIGKQEYVDALKNFDLLGSFPDMNNRFHNIRVDPFEHDRGTKER